MAILSASSFQWLANIREVLSYAFSKTFLFLTRLRVHVRCCGMEVAGSGAFEKRYLREYALASSSEDGTNPNRAHDVYTHI